METGQKGFFGFLEILREDYRAHQRDWTLPGFRAVALHRFGVWVGGLRPRLLRAPFSFIYATLYRYVRNHYGIELPRSAKVGRRFLIGHQGAIAVHYAAEIGDDCIIRQCVTLGAASVETVERGPVLKNRVEVGAGAVIMGAVVIGDDVRIGPNAVVTMNIPAGSTVVAPASRVVQFRRPAPRSAYSDATDSDGSQKIP
jgi:serine O-acetyltransferase